MRNLYKSRNEGVLVLVTVLLVVAYIITLSVDQCA